MSKRDIKLTCYEQNEKIFVNLNAYTIARTWRQDGTPCTRIWFAGDDSITVLEDMDEIFGGYDCSK